MKVTIVLLYQRLLYVSNGDLVNLNGGNAAPQLIDFSIR